MVGPRLGAIDPMDGAAYELETGEAAEVCWPTLTAQRSRRPVPGAVLHVMAWCGTVTEQPTAAYSVPEGP